MVSLYLVFALFGITIFVLSIFGLHGGDVHDGLSHISFGHDGIGHNDLGHHEIGNSENNLATSPGLFSLRTISAFLAGFGSSGLAAYFIGWHLTGQVILGFSTGIILALIAFGIMKLMYTQQAGVVNDSANLVGKSGVITVSSGDQGIGEIHIENMYYTCKEKTSKSLGFNQVVKVIESQNGLLIVEKVN